MVDTYLQEEYIEKLSYHLDGFRKVRDNLYNFRCPICGDSAFDKFKRRGYLICEDEKGYHFYCHNCGVGYPFKKFLETIDNDMYREYVTRGFRKQTDFMPKKEKDFKVKSFRINPKISILKKYLVPISKMDDNSDAKKYISGRNVPKEQMKFIFWTEDFPSLVHDFIGDKYDNSWMIEKGIVFILRDLNGVITGFQIRDIYTKDKKNRFNTCTITEEKGFFYTKLDKTQPIFVVEGCIDSLFLPNCIAALTSTIWKVELAGCDCIYFNDQEPRNKEVTSQIKKCIKKSMKVVLLPSYYVNKDVNDLINMGLSQTDLLNLFNENTYKGLSAEIKLSNWCR